VPGVAFDRVWVTCQTNGIFSFRSRLLFCNSSQLAKVPCSFLETSCNYPLATDQSDRCSITACQKPLHQFKEKKWPVLI
jgi:hypothetical protein